MVDYKKTLGNYASSILAFFIGLLMFSEAIPLNLLFGGDWSTLSLKIPSNFVDFILGTMFLLGGLFFILVGVFGIIGTTYELIKGNKKENN